MDSDDITSIPNSPRVAVLTVVSGSGESGGAERFYSGLIDGLRAIGCAVQEISVTADESTFENILGNYQHVQELDLSDYNVVVSTKAPTFAVRHPRHVMYLVHTIRVFDDMFSQNFPNPTNVHMQQRSEIHRLDTEGMEGAVARFTIGHEVSDRLYRWRGIDSQVIHPPVVVDGLYNAEPQDFIFMPGRLHEWKRVHLLIEAVKQSDSPIKLKISGTGSSEAELRALAGTDDRIEFLGRVSDEELKRLYAECLAVAFVPVREDYGYITIEAFASAKPVLTCVDSGEPTQFVTNGITGWVCAPEAEMISRTLDSLYKHKDETIQIGHNARDSLDLSTWPDVAKQLLTAAYDDSESGTDEPQLNVSVLDMQPITPTVGGGRQRLLGLYHDLGDQIHCHYTGSYDWPGEKYRALQLTSKFTETTVPLSDAHHRAAADLAARCGGKVVIDLAFSEQAKLSSEYLDEVRGSIANADVIVFSHPWVFPLVQDCIQPHQTIVYDSQNVEGFLRAQLLDRKNPAELELIKQVARDEYAVGTQADLIFCCSHEDMLRFARIYGFPFSKLRVVPNGIMTFDGAQDVRPGNREVRDALGVITSGGLVSIFIGSPYGPNVDAARFIAAELAPAMPSDIFIIAGGVSETVKGASKNVILTGQIDDADKAKWFSAADLAINPMNSGSGTNIKMFDFMAHGLPVISTAVGARGIPANSRSGILLSEASVADFGTSIDKMRNLETREKYSEDARRLVQSDFAWERVSRFTGALITGTHKFHLQPEPLFSVVIPTYERHDHLNELIDCLVAQTERDFEVVIIDQSKNAWNGAKKAYGFPLNYFHTPVKGAVRARNTGAALARGQVIAYTDDDCRPAEHWLLNARRYFQDEFVVGLEGLIRSDHLSDPGWRPVSNIGFEGIGFMTANLFARSSAVQAIGGFDMQFDKPHFREDTDFGWRLGELGQLPYARDVEVFHPAQRRDTNRESHEARAVMFQNDALLYRKHPDKYQSLFFREAQYVNGRPGFKENLLAGFKIHDIEMPRWLLDIIE